jgi:dTDP-L-rhamnose 4-epimerase
MDILVTGGCGFIGSHLVDRLIEEGHKVKVLDCLEQQVHKDGKPSFLNPEAEYIFADIRNKEKTKESLEGVDVVFHQASQVGVGQSMYQIQKYVSHNSEGTAVLLDAVINSRHKVKKLIVASSMSIYGEGAYSCIDCGLVYPALRSHRQLQERKWEMLCPKCGKIAKAIPTSEEKTLYPTSIYATTKRSQEEMCLEVGLAYKLPTTALRYFNVYGPRQSLNNPYTGVAAIFLSRVKNDKPPLVFEDGKQSRDFINVADIVSANLLAMKKEEANYDFFNVGSGKSHSILNIAETIADVCGKELNPRVLNKFRAGDIRHCYADIRKIKEKLGFEPKVPFAKGMQELIEWSESQPAEDLTGKAQEELKTRGLAE